MAHGEVIWKEVVDDEVVALETEEEILEGYLEKIKR